MRLSGIGWILLALWLGALIGPGEIGKAEVETPGSPPTMRSINEDVDPVGYVGDTASIDRDRSDRTP